MSAHAVTRRASGKSVVLVSPDAAVRERLSTLLIGMRWVVLEASGGAEAIQLLEEQSPEAVMVDHWLPDLEVGGFTHQVASQFPEVDLIGLDGVLLPGSARSPRRNELLHALREAQDLNAMDTAAWKLAPVAVPSTPRTVARVEVVEEVDVVSLLPGVVGNTAAMREAAKLVRLVAPTAATVLIEGDTGTGKELIARAVHQLSERSSKPFVVLNCAAIPEALLEAELFGHSRGAFTGAVQSRTGRIEAANGGTLFLDEIGEMPLSLQAKLLRFLENGELQRVGENEPVKVDVRIVAATHQHLEARSGEGLFRLDLYHRLSVFPIDLPSLRDRLEDLPMLVDRILEQLGEAAPLKRITPAALQMLKEHSWPGNVRELGHVLQRAAILAENRPEITPAEIRLRRRTD